MTEQELRDEFEKIKNDYGCIGLLNNEFKWFQKGYSLAQETIAEQELRIEFEHEAWCDTQNNISKICNCMMSYPLEIIENLKETIKAKDALIEKLEQKIKDIEWRMV